MTMKSKLLFLILGILYLSINGDAADVAVRQVMFNATVRAIEVKLEKEVDSLRNESATGSFNDPILEPSAVTVITYFNLVADSDGDKALNLKYVKAFGLIKPFPFGFCEHGPVWAAHYVPGYFFWPPILKRVCARPCPLFGQRCRPSCCETECVYRFVWRCTGGFCIRLGWRRICYDQHNCCKCTCRFSSPFCNL